MRPGSFFALIPAALAGFYAFGQTPSPYEPVLPPQGDFTGAIWAVNRAVSSPDIPKAGRSLFDQLYSKDGKYAIPFPFAYLLKDIQGRVLPTPDSPTGYQAVMLPFSRSLQRRAGGLAEEWFKAPGSDRDFFFRSPRISVAVDGLPPAPKNGQMAPLLRDRLYLGYQERTGVLEVISYNDASGRFEFQVAENYAPKTYLAGKQPTVYYANRVVCLKCHQNLSPIFPAQPWDDTNANEAIASKIIEVNSKPGPLRPQELQDLTDGIAKLTNNDARANRIATYQGRPVKFHGVPIDLGGIKVIPSLVDAAAKRANYLAAAQRIWGEGCAPGAAGAADPATCRAAALAAAIEIQLKGAGEAALEPFPEFKSAFQSNVDAAFRTRPNWMVKAADGSLLPSQMLMLRNFEVPNRLLSEGNQLVSSLETVNIPLTEENSFRDDPIVPRDVPIRPYLEAGRSDITFNQSNSAADVTVLNRQSAQGFLVQQLGESMLAPTDLGLIDQAITAKAAALQDLGALSSNCQGKFYGGDPTRDFQKMSLDCASPGPVVTRGAGFHAEVSLGEGNITKLSLMKFSLVLPECTKAGGAKCPEVMSSVELTGTYAPGSRKIVISPKLPSGARLRMNDGTLVDSIELSWDASAKGINTPMTAQATVKARRLDEMKKLVQSALALAKDSGGALSQSYFQRGPIVHDLLAKISGGLAVASPDVTAGLAPAVDERPVPDQVLQLQDQSEKATKALAAMQKNCAICHANKAGLNWLYDDGHLDQKIKNCAGSIHQRLTLWSQPAEQRLTNAMPVGINPEVWYSHGVGNDDYQAILAYVDSLMSQDELDQASVANPSDPRADRPTCVSPSN